MARTITRPIPATGEITATTAQSAATSVHARVVRGWGKGRPEAAGAAGVDISRAAYRFPPPSRLGEVIALSPVS